MGCGSSAPETVQVQHVQHVQHPRPQQVTTTTHYAGAPAVQYPQTRYPPQHAPAPGYQRPYPQQRVGYAQAPFAQQPNTVIVQDRGSSGGDFVVGMAAGAMMSNALHGPQYGHHHGYYDHGFHGHGYHDHGFHDHHATEVHQHDHFHGAPEHQGQEFDYGVDPNQGGYDGGFDGGGGGGFDGGFDDGGGGFDGGFDDGGGFDGGE